MLNTNAPTPVWLAVSSPYVLSPTPLDCHLYCALFSYEYTLTYHFILFY
jgi:hypothetical protein